MYLIRMMTLLREMENKEGLASHAKNSSGASSKKIKQGGGDNNLNFSTTTNNVNNSTSKYKMNSKIVRENFFKCFFYTHI